MLSICVGRVLSGFTIVITSLWPYLQLVRMTCSSPQGFVKNKKPVGDFLPLIGSFPQIDVSADASFLGWVVAAYSLGQMIASPLFGLWSNYRPRKEPLVCSIVINLSANIYYAYAYLPTKDNKFHMLMSRAFVGFGAGDLSGHCQFTLGYVSHSLM